MRIKKNYFSCKFFFINKDERKIFFVNFFRKFFELLCL